MAGAVNAVATGAIWVRQMKHDAQFITTTFRPELLEAGDKVYMKNLDENF